MPRVHPLAAKIERSLVLTVAESRALDGLPIRTESVSVDQVILREGDQPVRCFQILEGLVCSSKAGRDGGRQIIALHIPEDLPDLTSLHLDLRDCDALALTVNGGAISGQRAAQ